MHAPETVEIRLPKGALGGWDVLVRHLRIAKDKTGLDMVFQGLIDQIEKQLPKPRPEEPQTVGAIVRAACVHDLTARRWVRDQDGNWHDLRDLRYRATDMADDWDSLIDPVILYDGLEAVTEVNG